MTVYVEVGLCVIHVLRGINLVELSLAIRDFEPIIAGKVSVLAEISGQQGRVVFPDHIVKAKLVH